MDINLALMAGVDIPLPELKVTLHQPTIQDIARMGEQDLFSAIHYLCLNKQALIEDKTLLKELTNFQVLMKVIEQFDTSDKKISILTLFTLLFPNYKPIITPNSIILNNFETKENVIIDDNNFDNFQNVIKQVLCFNKLFQGDNVTYNPVNEKAKEIAEKLIKGRKKAAALKAKEEKENSVLGRYISILTIGVPSMSLESCLSLTLYQLFDLIERFTLYVEWNTDLEVRLAGGSPKSQAENWMKNIH